MHRIRNKILCAFFLVYMHSKRMLTLNTCPFKWSTVIFQQASAQNNLSSSHQELKFLLQGAISYFTTEEKVQNAKCLECLEQHMNTAIFLLW